MYAIDNMERTEQILSALVKVYANENNLNREKITWGRKNDRYTDSRDASSCGRSGVFDHSRKGHIEQED